MHAPRLLLVAAVLAATATAAPPAQAASSAREAAERSLDRAQAALDGRGGVEATLALRDLHRRLGALRGDERAAAGALFARPTADADDDDPTTPHYEVEEEEPLESEHFRFHYVTTTGDAVADDDEDADGFPDYVETARDVFEEVHFKQNVELGWPEPPSDGARGGNALLDVYFADVGKDDTYGYVAPDETQDGDERDSMHTFQVMDNDYAEFGDREPLDSLMVTAAHEYNHVLQYGLEPTMEDWVFEATATWMEDVVYPAIDDYLQYVPDWAAASSTSLTTFDDSQFQYGSAVWVHWFAGRHGAAAVRQAWRQRTPSGPDAFDRAARAAQGTTFARDFVDFSAALAEWRTGPAAGFAEGAKYAPVARSASPLVRDGAGVTARVDHVARRLFDVQGAGTGPLELRVSAPGDLPAAIALVGRTGGDDRAGEVVTVVKELPAGGDGTVVLPDVQRFGRVTAVVTNIDVTRDAKGVYLYDDQPLTARVVTPTAPAPAPPTPGPGPGPQPQPQPQPLPVPPGPQPGPAARTLTIGESTTLVATALTRSVTSFRRLTLRRLALPRTRLPHPFLFPADGSVAISWTARSRGGRLVARGGRVVTIARGTLTGRAGQLTSVPVAVTPTGRRLLRRTRSTTTLTLSSRFVGGAATLARPATATGRLRLRAR